MDAKGSNQAVPDLLKICDRSGYNYQDLDKHPSRKADLVWHAFFDKLKESWNGGPSVIHMNNLFNLESRKFNMLSDYLNAIDFYKTTMQNDAERSIKLYQKEIEKLSGNKYFPDYKRMEECKISIEKINAKLSHSLYVLSTIPSEIIPLYQQILSSCPHKGVSNLALTYNEGLFGFIMCDYETSLDKINEFVVFAETSGNQDSLLNSKIFQTQGESYLEVGLYHEAIIALTKSIEKDPTNKEAYFSRAVAHFETGDFDLAVNDYMSSEAKKDLSQSDLKIFDDFDTALLKGIFEGGKESANEFVPSLCNTACGVGKCMWCFVQQPVDVTVNFCKACKQAEDAITEYVKNLDQEQVEELTAEFTEEVVKCFQKFDGLTQSEKGHVIGHCIGKYGVDILLGGVTLKGLSAIKNIRNANRMGNLEALVSSETAKEAIKAAALQHAAEKECFFKKVVINWNKQNKHVLSAHNFESGKSILTHKDPQSLLKMHAGKGKKVRGDAGEFGYQELVDFGEYIGYNVDYNGVETLTTWGKIHYAKDGAHIVPTIPRL